MSEPVERIFTEEERARVARFLPMKPNADFLYVPAIFREFYPEDQDEWPVFILKAHDGISNAMLEDHITASQGADGAEIHAKTGSQRLNILKSGIINCRNWKDADGKEIKLTRDEQKKGKPVATSFLRQMPVDLQIELANAITERSELAPEEIEGLKF